jgi:hypothetical protein
VQTHQIHVSNGRDRVDEVRTELFTFSEVLDVFVTSRPDALVVVCSGCPRPGEWLRHLCSVGYDVPPRRRANAAAVEAGRTDVVEPRASRAPSARAQAVRRAHTEMPRFVRKSLPGQPAAGY